MSTIVSTGVTAADCNSCAWSNHGRLVRVDRWLTDAPPIPQPAGGLIEFYLDSACDPDDLVIDCRMCGMELE